MPDTLYTSKELSDKDLKYSRFIVTYRPILKKILLGSFIFITIALLFFGIGGSIKYLAGTKSFNATMSELHRANIDWNSIRPLVTRPGIVIEEIQTVQSGSNTDFIARVTNPNINRYAEGIEYRFLWDGGETEWRNSFILVNDTKHLLALGVDSGNVGTAALEFRNLHWKNIYGDALDNMKEIREGVEISGGTIETLGGSSGILPLSSISFSVNNNTPFTYSISGFVIIVTSGSFYTVVTYETLHMLEAFEIRDVEARMFQRLNPSGGQTVIIEADINFFDDNNILL